MSGCLTKRLNETMINLDIRDTKHMCDHVGSPTPVLFHLSASTDFYVKLASNKISSSSGMFIYGATTFTLGLAWVGYLKLTHQPVLATYSSVRFLGF